ncbi:MAG: asparagine synthase-related protein, partial [Candidatus Hydrothermarchaeota archaeon]|nr:asparagine synthase-related protein [Candidatus Hydrothermarchaeota archaeon]
FASERKPLWSIGREAAALKPGRVISLGGKLEEGVDFRSYRRKVKKPVEELCDALTTAVEKRTWDVKVGLLFSGGLDSSLLAKIVEELGREAVLYTVGLNGCRDFEYAEKASDVFDFELKCRVIKEEDLADYARKVVYAIEEYNPMKVSVGIPLYAACEAAKKDGLKVVIAGQGADELFAGYKRYLRFSGDRLEEELLKDIERIAEVNLQRDDAIAMANSLELRVPYMDREVVGIAMGLPTNYKIKAGRRKHILRLAARKKGLPDFIVERGKKAVQYSTGVEKALRMLAKEKDKSVEGYLKSIYEELFPWR